jgi:hypothetical protein
MNYLIIYLQNMTLNIPVKKHPDGIGVLFGWTELLAGCFHQEN